MILKVASRMFMLVKSIIEESNPVEIMCHVVKSPLEVVIEVRVNFYYENFNLLVDFALRLEVNCSLHRSVYFAMGLEVNCSLRRSVFSFD